MIKIKLKNLESKPDLMSPLKVLDNKWDYGTIFRGYHRGKPTKDFFITCGRGENSVIHLWYNDDEVDIAANRGFKFSTSDLEDLSEYVDTHKVYKIDADIKMEVLIK